MNDGSLNGEMNLQGNGTSFSPGWGLAVICPEMFKHWPRASFRLDSGRQALGRARVSRARPENKDEKRRKIVSSPCRRIVNGMRIEAS
jgi:hypothetical protein